MNLKEIFELMDKFDSSNLSEIKVQIADTSVSFKKPGPAPVIAAGGYMPHPMMGAPVPAAHSEAASSAAVPAAKPGVELVTSPIVGTFYRSAAPDTPAFVQEGQVVDNGGTLCILEAMKVMNRLEAEFKCEVVKILATNGQMVEFGTPLFEVKRV